MPRPQLADEAGGFNHALNCGHGRSQIFWTNDDDSAFEQIMAAELADYDVSVFSFPLRPNHWHLELRPNVDGEISRLLRWLTATHTIGDHAHDHTSGEGHVYQGRFKSFSIQDDERFLTVCRHVERNALRSKLVSRAEQWRWGSLWQSTEHPEPKPTLLFSCLILYPRRGIERVNPPLTEKELAAVRDSVKRGCPFGDFEGVEPTVKELGLQSILRQRGRPRVRNPPRST
jgi:putative transposase